MSLISRVIKLESKFKAPTNSVHVIFQQVGESDDKVKKQIKSQNFDFNNIVIIVNFI